MGQDAGEVLRQTTRLGESGVHGPQGGGAIRPRLREVMRVGRAAVSGDFGQNGRPAPARVGFLLQQQDARAFRDHEPVPVPVKRAGRLARRVVAGAQGAHGAEAAHDHLAEGRLAAAGQHRIGFARADEPARFADG